MFSTRVQYLQVTIIEDADATTTDATTTDATRTVVLMAYDYAFRDMEMGQGAAVSVILFFIIGFFVFIQFKTFKENE